MKRGIRLWAAIQSPRSCCRRRLRCRISFGWRTADCGLSGCRWIPQKPEAGSSGTARTVERRGRKRRSCQRNTTMGNFSSVWRCRGMAVVRESEWSNRIQMIHWKTGMRSCSSLTRTVRHSVSRWKSQTFHSFPLRRATRWWLQISGGRGCFTGPGERKDGL